MKARAAEMLLQFYAGITVQGRDPDLAPADIRELLSIGETMRARTWPSPQFFEVLLPRKEQSE